MSIFGKLAGTVIRTALLPVAIVQDVATMGGAVTEKREPYTATALKGLGRSVKGVIEELEND